MSYQSRIDAAEQALEAARAAVHAELAAYPTPVSGCDQQYTHLIACRTRITQAQSALGREVFVATPRTLSPGAGVEIR